MSLVSKTTFLQTLALFMSQTQCIHLGQIWAKLHWTRSVTSAMKVHLGEDAPNSVTGDQQSYG